MTHSTNILPRSVDYDQTLVLAIELSDKGAPSAAEVHGFFADQGEAGLSNRTKMLCRRRLMVIEPRAAGRSVKGAITSQGDRVAR